MPYRRVLDSISLIHPAIVAAVGGDLLTCVNIDREALDKIIPEENHDQIGLHIFIFDDTGVATAIGFAGVVWATAGIDDDRGIFCPTLVIGAAALAAGSYYVKAWFEPVAALIEGYRGRSYASLATDDGFNAVVAPFLLT